MAAIFHPVFSGFNNHMLKPENPGIRIPESGDCNPWHSQIRSRKEYLIPTNNIIVLLCCCNLTSPMWKWNDPSLSGKVCAQSDKTGQFSSINVYISMRVDNQCQHESTSHNLFSSVPYPIHSGRYISSDIFRIQIYPFLLFACVQEKIADLRSSLILSS